MFSGKVCDRSTTPTPNASETTRFLEAAETNDIRTVRALLSTAFGSVMERDKALILAIREGHKGIVECLLDEGVDVNLLYTNRKPVISNIGNTFRPIHMAASAGSVEVLDILIRHGANPNDHGRSSWDATTCPLNIAACEGHEDVVQYLLDSGADPNRQNGAEKLCALHEAVLARNPKVVDILLAGGADVNSRTADGCTPLHYAAENGDMSIAEKLVRCGASVHDLDRHGKNALSRALEGKCTSVARFLCVQGSSINTFNVHGMNSVHCASAMGDLSLIKLLIQFGGKLNCESEHGKIPLHYAVSNFCFRGGLSESVKNKELIDYLINSGSNLNHGDRSGNTPLHICAVEGTVDVLQYILKFRPKYDIVNKSRDTPLTSAIWRPVIENIYSKTIEDNIKTLIRLCPGLLKHAANHRRNIMHQLGAKGDTANLWLLIEAGYAMTLHELDTLKGVFSDNMADFQALQNELANPSPLLRMSRNVIRDLLYDGIEEKVTMLPVPTRVKSEITLMV